jgi:class 3 adenylate cyclase/tetratricopeptide (TPR) repeat protein
MRCAACGATHQGGQKFCAECGAALGVGVGEVMAGAQAITASTPGEPEMRFVAVLFVDLVGFTTLSESRDAEDVRDLLGRYFTVARTIVERYGGALEKFIGDAVMAVWGATVAREDDAERAVRAALEIVDAVSVLGAELGADGLRARAGVVTGQAAALDNPGQGIVVGDRVNTASRVQSVAGPGSVLVDEITHRVASGAILFEDAGAHAVKGKLEPLHLWRALRVVAGAGGRGRDAGFEAPFSGRDPDLRLLKDLFHGSLDRGVARLVSISGGAGVGKSRLVQELLNYSDGLADLFLWHTGRCLAHGEGIAYWALSEMVRQRLGIPEDAPDAEVSAKLAAGLAEWVGDPADREFMAPRLGALLGVTETGLGQAELFAGWRMFFERLAAHESVVMVFEDMQRADAGLLQFIEQLVDWSSALPIFVVVLARPELAASHDGWPVGRRGATIVQLEPLAAADIRALVVGLVDGLPEDAVEQIVERAQGIPLYAIETVRSLVDRGVVVQRDGGRLTLDGELGELEVPATLNALLAARLDALDAAERTVVKAMSVFGGSFPRHAAAALAELSDSELDTALGGLVRKQVLVVRADPLSPDRGQYAYAQGLLRNVAYELLSRRERKARHLAAAAHLRRSFANDGEEVAEVIASHHLSAYAAAGEDEDADVLRVATVDALRRAGQHAGAVGALDVAQRLYAQAAELSSDEREQAELSASAGEIALNSGRTEEALAILEEVAAAHASAGRERESLRLVRSIGLALWRLGRGDEAITLLSPAVDALATDAFDRDAAELNSVLGRLYALQGDHERARLPLDAALTAAQALDDPALLSDALSSQAVALLYSGRPQEAAFNFVAAIEIAERNEVSDVLGRAQINAGNTCMLWDLPGARGYLEAALAGSRRRGQRVSESISAANMMYVDLLAGRWDEVERLGDELLAGNEDRPGKEFVHLHLADLMLARGKLDSARAHVGELDAWRESDDPENASTYSSVLIGLRLAEQRSEEALDLGMRMLAPTIKRLSAAHDTVRMSWPFTLDAALAAGRFDDARAVLALLSEWPRGLVPPYLHAQLRRGRALISIATGEEDEVEPALRDALARFTTLAYPYWLAVTQTDLAAWLIDQGQDVEAVGLLETALATLTPLCAAPALERVHALQPHGRVAV